jgi:surfeit locus 1 family protein
MSVRGRYSLLGVTVLAAAACAALGVWQLRRLEARRTANLRSLSQRDLPPVDLNRELPTELTYRRVTVVGRYDLANEFVLRSRALRGSPGVQVVTPLRLPGRDTALLVNRGFVPAADAAYPGPGLTYREPADAEVRGVALPVPDEGDGAPLGMPRGETWRRLDRTAMGARLSYPLAPYYIIAEADAGSGVDHAPGGRVLPIRIEPPSLDNGPHLAYAIQWFSIGAAALVFGVAFTRRATRLGSGPGSAPRPGDPAPP